MLAASLTNLLDTATLTPSSEQAGYPASRLIDPALGLPWKTTATGAQSLIVDHGSAKAVGIFAAMAGNFTTIQLRRNSTSSWGGTTPYDVTLTLGKCPGCGDPIVWRDPRYNAWVIPSATAYQFDRWDIPSQATLDGAAYYRLGALHAGAVTSLRNFRLDYDPTPTQATSLVTAMGGAEQEAILGHRRMRITGTKNDYLMKTTDGSSATTTALLGDGIDTQMEFEGAWKADGRALLVPNSAHPYWVGYFRLHDRVSRKVGYPVDDASFEWRGVE